ncbi:MAG: carboxy-S-adenosyl-L-methionine synthase CmoA [Gammaproteobacteria bacterium]|nr:carboxy-S-adenosyl-L-methionine synthase CmoA [Gammaproteobacteria bacterium]
MSQHEKPRKTQRDELFNSPGATSPFCFDEQVAAVFPDMIQRSVPGYDFIINGIEQFAERFITPATNAYDLGCSLGAAALAMSRGSQHIDTQIVGIDNSAAMVERCRIFCEAYRHKNNIDIHCQTIQQTTLENASMVVLNFTLQFIEQSQRQAIIEQIYQGLNPGGVLILSEKILAPNPQVNQLLIDMHHDFKRANGYSDLEISQKRTALENVLIPETLTTHHQRLASAGFRCSEVWQQQYNFCSILAIK